MADRLSDMLERYGEVCTKTAAAKILGCSVGKIKAMLKDGRLSVACEGTMVDVRSIAGYIQRPAQIDRETRLRKLGRAWSV